MDNVTSTDRLLFTLIFSIILHVVIVLGISFNTFKALTNTPKMSLDITLVKQQTQEKPDEADYLAQANNRGGGVTPTKTPDPMAHPVVPEKPHASSQPAAPKPPVKAHPESQPMQTGVQTTFDTVADAPTSAKVAPPALQPVTPKVRARPDKLLVQAKAKRKVEQPRKKAPVQPQQTPSVVTPPTQRRLVLPTEAEIASLEHHFDRLASALSKHPRKRKISARTKEFAAAAYMKAWEMKVERIGNYNYPKEAKRKGINGSLMLSVDINPDGSVPPDGIVVSRSSGHKILDEAAVRIVRLGAPYAPIPKDVLKGHDMLTIIRTWKFESGKGLSTH